MTTVTRSTASSTVATGEVALPQQTDNPDQPFFLSGRFADDRPLQLRMLRPGNGILVIEASGALDTVGSHRLAEALRHRLASTASCIILDASAVAYSNASGVAALLDAALHAKERNKALKVISSDAVDRLLDLLGVAGKLSLSASTELALRAHETEVH